MIENHAADTEPMPDRDPWLELLDELEGSVPGLSAAVDLQALRDEWEREPSDLSPRDESPA